MSLVSKTPPVMRHDWLLQNFIDFFFLCFLFLFLKVKTQLTRSPTCATISLNLRRHQMRRSMNLLMASMKRNRTVQRFKSSGENSIRSVKAMIYWSNFSLRRDSSPSRNLLVQYLADDRNENSLSYYEFLQHLRTQVSK